MTFAENILSFIKKLTFPVELPNGIEVMVPFEEPATMQACKLFYKKFYSDHQQRRMIIGINPGRFGGGVTGIPFTDPIRLQNDCGIENGWVKKQELSSLYVYEMINAFGGVAGFYRQFYITAVSPLGFTKDGKNLNYYDDKTLQDRIKPFVIDCFNKQFAFGIDRTVAFCLGDGKNFKYLSKLNAEQHFFEKIVPLSHPRFIMQYRLKKKQEYIDKYVQELSVVSP
ncbi:MAG: uracil-DNA glycosylase family protein [Bacteroidota bacterium]